MQETTNYGLKKPEDSDSNDLTVFVGENMEIIDSALADLAANSGGGTPDAADIPIADTAGNFTATDVEGALTELFTNVSNGKIDIAAAVTAMGQAISGSATFDQLATAIGAISSDATANVSDILAGKTAYKGGKITGTMPSRAYQESAQGTWTDGAGQLALKMPTGAYITEGGFGPGFVAPTVTDADFIAQNILNTANIFGLQGSIPRKYFGDGDAPVGQGDHFNAAGSTAGNYSGDGNTWAYLQPYAGAYGGNVWVRALANDLLPQNILLGKNILGVVGTAIAGKRWATGTFTTSSSSLQVTVNGLSFTPSFYIYFQYGSATNTRLMTGIGINPGAIWLNGTIYNAASHRTNNSNADAIQVGNVGWGAGFIQMNTFTIGGTTCRWYAFE